jgi:hypothetical protein
MPHDAIRAAAWEVREKLLITNFKTPTHAI